VSKRFQPLVLCYHAVSESWPHLLAVTPQAFERQLRSLLLRGYRPVTAAEAVSGDSKVFHVTFDDAFTSIANALPTLARLAVPATVFACPSYADDGRPLAVPELAAEAAAYPDELATMPWDELRDLSSRNIEIGSHTLSHAHLTQLSAAELDDELRESRERIEAELGRPCPFVAYPYGDDDDRVHRAARAAGYEAGFAAPGRLVPPSVHALPRVGVFRQDGIVRMTLKTTGLVRRVLDGRR
jgi:peptidoglycan/xylan/chitin deacetylase (PgdA/CDA1 family)